MIFEYEELKACVKEDFERFYKMGFNENQIFLAVLNEYEHGEDFGLVENVCVHVFLLLAYKEKKMSCNQLIERLNQIVKEDGKTEIKVELGNEYSKFVADLSKFKSTGDGSVC